MIRDVQPGSRIQGSKRHRPGSATLVAIDEAWRTEATHVPHLGRLSTQGTLYKWNCFISRVHKV
jgi:hypothetical protein